MNGRHTNAVVRWASGVDGTADRDMCALVNGPAPNLPNYAGLGPWINEPFSRGRVAITTIDPDVDPDIDMNLADDPRDLERLRGCIALARDVLAHPEFAAAIDGEIAGIDGTPLRELVGGRETDEWIGRVVDGSAHASATCRLGSVVDADCRVLGTEGLRVIDLSIVPSVPRANTNLTAIMIGEHMAARLRAE